MPFHIIEYQSSGFALVSFAALPADTCTREEQQARADRISQERKHATRVVKLAEGVDAHAWAAEYNRHTLRTYWGNTSPGFVREALEAAGAVLVPHYGPDGPRLHLYPVKPPGRVRAVAVMTLAQLAKARDLLHQGHLIRSEPVQRLRGRRRVPSQQMVEDTYQLPPEDLSPDDPEEDVLAEPDEGSILG